MTSTGSECSSHSLHTITSKANCWNLKRYWTASYFQSRETEKVNSLQLFGQTLGGGVCPNNLLKEKKMTTRKLLVSVLMLVSVLFSACVPAVTLPIPTAIPDIVVPATVPTAKVIAEWKVNNPSGVFIGFDSVWIPDHHSFTTTRIDPATNKIIAVIKGTGDHSEQALAVCKMLWVTGRPYDTTSIDPHTNDGTTNLPRLQE